MKQGNIAFLTLGCKINQYETNAMAQKFKEEGYEVIEYESSDIKSGTEIDIYVINTCTVTNISDRKSRQVLRKAKQKNEKGVLIATGCYVQIAKDKLNEIKEIDLILGNEEKKDIVKYVEKFLEKKERKENKADLCFAPQLRCQGKYGTASDTAQ